MRSEKQSLIDEAAAILSERSGRYPSFVAESERVCEAVNAILPGFGLTPSRYALVLMVMKLVREGHAHWRDNLLDFVGYAARLDEIHNRE